ncbi:MAG TPA: lytic murein transglycosylase [Solirubrobacterales bacterium]|nr:lytic murein transglycosylase [Solirubrobacterales bacterium]
MGRLRNTLAVAAVGAALTASNAAAAEAPPAAPTLEQNETLAVPESAAPAAPTPSGGTAVEVPSPEEDEGTESTPAPQPDAGATPAPTPTELFEVPSIPSSSCAASGVPPVLIPIYNRAAATYGLGPQGPSILASINGIESAFGTNMGPSSAGAIGWMQFMPATWAEYGVDANGDEVRDPYNPEDAIFAAARYLNAAGMPANTYDAIFAYNHADWYVADVLANASCYGALGGGVGGGFALTPQLQGFNCEAAPAWRDKIPDEYMEAFEAAASRYELGQRGVWALAAVARLESNFGRGMGNVQMRLRGPLGLEPSEWKKYAVDGNEDGHVHRGDPADSAATLARLIWSRGSLRAGIFTHNQAQWYVQAVLAEAEQLEGKCQVTTVDWPLALPGTAGAPINWDNLTLSNELELRDITSGALDPRLVALIGAITQQHQLTISSLRSDHSQYTVDGNVSNHFYGRAVDIAAVDGVSCTDTAVDAPCAQLGTTLAYLPAPAHPSELIYCFDLDGPGPAFARSDHCDHVHAGYDG